MPEKITAEQVIEAMATVLAGCYISDPKDGKELTIYGIAAFIKTGEIGTAFLEEEVGLDSLDLIEVRTGIEEALRLESNMLDTELFNPEPDVPLNQVAERIVTIINDMSEEVVAEKMVKAMADYLTKKFNLGKLLAEKGYVSIEDAIERSNIGGDDLERCLGFDSLNQVEMVAAIEEETGVTLPEGDRIHDLFLPNNELTLKEVAVGLAKIANEQ